MKFFWFNLGVFLAIASIHLGAEVPNTFESGTPAKASEVNENFSALSSALDADWSTQSDRFYPDWRHEPTFYLELPELGGYWKGRLDKHHQSHFTTGWRNLIFVNIYDVTTPGAHLYLGMNINPTHDVSAYVDSLIAHEYEAGCLVFPFGCGRNRYTFDMRREKNMVSQSTAYTIDSELESSPYSSFYAGWRTRLTSDALVSLINQIYALLEVGSDDFAKHCETITAQLNADWTIDVSGSDCVEISYSQ